MSCFSLLQHTTYFKKQVVIWDERRGGGGQAGGERTPPLNPPLLHVNYLLHVNHMVTWFGGKWTQLVTARIIDDAPYLGYTENSIPNQIWVFCSSPHNDFKNTVWFKRKNIQHSISNVLHIANSNIYIYTYSEILKEYRGNNVIKVLFNRTKHQSCTQRSVYTILNQFHNTGLMNYVPLTHNILPFLWLHAAPDWVTVVICHYSNTIRLQAFKQVLWHKIKCFPSIRVSSGPVNSSFLWIRLIRMIEVQMRGLGHYYLK